MPAPSREDLAALLAAVKVAFLDGIDGLVAGTRLGLDTFGADIAEAIVDAVHNPEKRAFVEGIIVARARTLGIRGTKQAMATVLRIGTTLLSFASSALGGLPGAVAGLLGGAIPNGDKS